jgi:(p)ppGpp synthase/HD superfamily hydrolase
MDISKFISIGEDGKPVIDTKGYQSEFDAEISKAVAKNESGAMREKIRKELETEAKLSADEKLKKDRDEFETFVKNSKIELNKEKAKAKFTGKNFTAKEQEIFLAKIDSDETSLSTIDELINEREAILTDVKKKAIESLQAGQQSSKGTNTAPPNTTNGNNEQQAQPKSWTPDEIRNIYK